MGKCAFCVAVCRCGAYSVTVNLSTAQHRIIRGCAAVVKILSKHAAKMICQVAVCHLCLADSDTATACGLLALLENLQVFGDIVAVCNLDVVGYGTAYNVTQAIVIIMTLRITAKEAVFNEYGIVDRRHSHSVGHYSGGGCIGINVCHREAISDDRYTVFFRCIGTVNQA